MLEDNMKKAKVLLEALPYFHKFYNKTLVIKFGGSILENSELKRSFAQEVVLLKTVGMNPVIVHGGGKEITRWMEKMGSKPRFIDGLRYTDQETMEVTEMVLSGKVNHDLLSLVNQAGGRAVGLSGKDAGLFLAQKIRSDAGQDLGYAGDIVKVDVALIKKLTENGYIPVISSIASDAEGCTLNVNADTAAKALAEALQAFKLIFLTDVQGICIGGSTISYQSLKEAESLLRHPEITGGMIPKLKNSISALKNGVDSVHILDGTCMHSVILELFTDAGIGTMITRNYEGQ